MEHTQQEALEMFYVRSSFSEEKVGAMVKDEVRGVLKCTGVNPAG